MKKFLLLSKLLCLLAASPLHAELSGHEGGGGDASEIRVDEIRSDILNWITRGGSKELILKDITLIEYREKMIRILQPKNVIVLFVENDNSDDTDLKVSVDGKPKTCRGFVSQKDLKPYILCNAAKFRGTSDSDQYKLIHHEFAGLVEVETNEGAASDYQISSQISDFLEVQIVLKLAVKPKIPSGQSTIICKYFPGGYDYETITLFLNGRNVQGIDYVSYQGPVGPFQKVNDFNFQYTTDDLEISEIISITNDLKSAIQMTVYKKTGNILSSNHFSCY